MTPPFAVMAAHDPRATMVIRGCERVGLRVPTDVAVIGVNDDSVTCETIRPSLTSIRRNGHEVGKQAGQMLHRLIAGKRTPNQIIISDEGIRERESTQTLAIDHPAHSAAVDFVNSHYQTNIGVEQIATASKQSRRWLEDAFRRELHCSPAEFLKRRRIQAAVQHLRDHDRCGPGILAAKCGFSGTRQLNAAFVSELGTSVKLSAKTESHRMPRRPSADSSHDRH